MKDNELLQELMRRNKWDQSQLAEKLDLSQRHVNQLLSGDAVVSPELRHLAEQLLKPDGTDY